MEMLKTTNEGQDIPLNIKDALGYDWERFASVYDCRALILDSIEKEADGKEVDLAVVGTITSADPTVSDITIADLYSIVNARYQRYLPQEDDMGHTDTLDGLLPASAGVA